MPIDNPQVGETWQMNDPLTGNPAQGVVSRADDQSVILVSRLGRRISVPRRSFNRAWRYLFNAPNETCFHRECTSPGYLQIQQLGDWVWVCEQHLPTGMAPLLPGDRPGQTSSQEGFANCPGCRTTFNRPGSGARSGEGGYTVWNCGACRGEWIQLIGQNVAADGSWFGVTIQDAAHVLEQEGMVVRCLIGSAAFLALDRAAGRLGDPPSIGGIPVIVSDAQGANNAVVLGERPTTGVQRLGGQPNWIAPDLPPGNLPVLNGPLVAPIVGSFWRTRSLPTIILTVTSVEYTESRADTSSSMEANTRVTEEDVAIVNEEGHFTPLPPPHRCQVIDLHTFAAIFEPVDRTLVNRLGFSISDLGPMITAAEWKSEFEKLGTDLENAPVKLPGIGEVWWFKDSPFTSVIVLETGRANDGLFIKVRDRQSVVGATFSPEVFYDRLTQKSLLEDFKVDEEYVDSDNTIVKIIAVFPERVRVRAEGGQPFDVSEATLRLNYRKFERKSVYELIGGDEEFF